MIIHNTIDHVLYNGNSMQWSTILISRGQALYTVSYIRICAVRLCLWSRLQCQFFLYIIINHATILEHKCNNQRLTLHIDILRLDAIPNYFWYSLKLLLSLVRQICYHGAGIINTNKSILLKQIYITGTMDHEWINILYYV